MGIKFANGGYATLASGITSSDTSITLTTGQGARFPSLAGGDYFYATLIDTSNNLEIVKCTARSTDVLTVTRAQESTTARSYSAGDRIELRITAQGLSDAAPVQSVAGRTGDVVLAASDIASGVFATARLASSGTASSSTFLRGDQSWQTITQAVTKITNAYYSTTRVATSFDRGTIISSENFVAPTGGPVSWSFTKDSASTAIVFVYSFSIGNGSQCHTSAIWKSDQSLLRRLGMDLGRNGNGSNTIAGVQYYTGLAAGSHTFLFSAGRSNDGANVSFVHNMNTSDNADMSGAHASSVVVLEVAV